MCLLKSRAEFVSNTHLSLLSTLEKKTREYNISFMSVQSEQFLLVQGLEQ